MTKTLNGSQDRPCCGRADEPGDCVRFAASASPGLTLRARLFATSDPVAGSRILADRLFSPVLVGEPAAVVGALTPPVSQAAPDEPASPAKLEAERRAA